MGWVTPIVEGIGQNQVDQAQAAQYNFNAKSELIAADEDSAARLSDLNSTISAVNAVRTSRGLDLASPTGMAISAGLTKRAESNVQTARLNYETKAQSDKFGAWGANQAGQYALLGGFLQGYDVLQQDAAKAAAAGG
jgi:hypothetical protein